MNTNGLEQRREALKTANARRSARSVLKQTLAGYDSMAESQQALARLLDTHATNPTITNARVSELLLACRGVHVNKMRAHLRAIQAGEWSRVGELTDRQLVILTGRLRGATD